MDSSPRDKLLLAVSKNLENAATDLQNGNVSAAGFEIERAAWKIQKELKEVYDDDE